MSDFFPYVFFILPEKRLEKKPVFLLPVVILSFATLYSIRNHDQDNSGAKYKRVAEFIKAKEIPGKLSE